MSRTVLSYMVIIVVVSHLGCGGPEQAAPPLQAIDSLSTETLAPARNPKIPVEVSYPVIRDEEEFNKRMVEVRLNQKVSEEVLREIALEVKAQETRQYERTFISVFLPEVVYGVKSVTPWATTHFNPTLEVKILGLTLDDEDKFKSRPITRGNELLGSWLMDRIEGYRVTIYREGSTYKLENDYGGSEPYIMDMVEVAAPAERRRFRPSGGGDQYEVDQQGNLRLYNSREELFYAAKPLQN